MNREIKFRVYVKEDEYSYEDMHYIDLSDSVSEYDSRVMAEFPIMQYTGLKDKNGVEIFEGDLVKYANPRHYSEDGVFEVEFAQGAFIAGYHTGSSTSKRPKLIIGKRVEIIGNKFQNPELLTQSIND